MTALHLLGADHFWSNMPMFVVLGLFMFLGLIALRSRIYRSANSVSFTSRPVEPREAHSQDGAFLPVSSRLQSRSAEDPKLYPTQES